MNPVGLPGIETGIEKYGYPYFAVDGLSARCDAAIRSCRSTLKIAA
jgi:hypothetical protein